MSFLAVALIVHDLNDVQVILTINNSKYAQLQEKHRLQPLIQVAGNEICTTEARDFASITPKLEQEWSSFHHFVQASLHAIAETYEVVMAIMHHFKPKFMFLLKGPPSYYNDYEFNQTCFSLWDKNELTGLMKEIRIRCT